MCRKYEILTERFLLKPLKREDVTERYLSWLCDEDTKRFITTAAKTKRLSELMKYVSLRTGRDDILFLGIFNKDNGLHIGNIKYKPVNSDKGYAEMGILIGDIQYRGKGVASEVLRSSARWLKWHRKIEQIVLGVDENNIAAIKAYQKVGFLKTATDHIKHVLPGTITMVWYL